MQHEFFYSIIIYIEQTVLTEISPIYRSKFSIPVISHSVGSSIRSQNFLIPVTSYRYLTASFYSVTGRCNRHRTRFLRSYYSIPDRRDPCIAGSP